MITDLIIDFVLGNIMALLLMLPAIPVPDWLTDGDGFLATVSQYAAGMGAWMPTQLLLTVQGVILLAWAAGFGVKAIRMVISLFSAGGGSAA